MADTDQLYAHPKQASFADYPRSIFQTKYGINLKKRLPAALLGSEDVKRTSPPPPPCKQLRLQDDDHGAPEAKTGQDAVVNGVGEVVLVVVKSEPLETDDGCDRDGGALLGGLDLSERKPRGADQQDGVACCSSPPPPPRHPAPSSTSFVAKSSPPGFDQSSCGSPAGGGGGGRDALPDSSTGTCEQLIRDGRRLSCVDESGSNMMTTTTTSPSGETILCQVCGDLAAGFYCGAYICEACKKFFIRASKLERPRYVCLRQKDCVITKESRVHCQYCRYQKCLQLSMFYPKDGQKNANKVGVQEIPCRVCSAPSSGFHFGALTCEGCKGFFRRMVKEREAYSYKCSKQGICEVNAMTRNMCKACRYNKCIQIGMSVEGSRIGRQPNAVKHAISLEAKKQAALRGTEPNTPCSKADVEISSTNISFESVVLDPCLPGDVDDSLQSLDQDHQGSPREIRNPKQENLSSPCQGKQCSDMESSPHAHPSGVQLHCDKPRMPPHVVPLEQVTYGQDHYFDSRLSPPSQAFHPSDGPCVPVFSGQPQDVGMDLSIRRSNSVGSNYLRTLNPSVSAAGYHHSSSSAGQFSTSQPLNMSPPASSLHMSQSHGCLLDADYSAQQQPYCHKRDKTRSHSFSYRPNSYSNYSTYAESNLPHLREGYREHAPSLPSSQPTHMYPSNSPFHQSDGVSYQHAPPYLRRSDPNDIHNSQDYHISSEMSRGGHQSYSPTRVRSYNDDTQQSLHSPERIYRNHSLHSNSHSHSQNVGMSKREQFYIKPVKPHKYLKSPYFGSEGDEEYCSPPELGYLKQEPSVTPKQIVDKVVMQDNDGNDITFKDLDDILSQAASALFHICITGRAKASYIDETKFISVDTCWVKMMEHFNFHAKCIVRFAKKVPGFRLLKIEDQVLLLRMATYSLVILTHSREYEPETGFYNYFNFTCNEMERILELFPEFDVIPSHFKHTGVMAKRLSLTDLEYAYLSCMLLLNDEHQGLIDTKKVKELKEKYVEAFHNYEIESFPNGDLRFGEMLLRLSEFSHFSMQHNIAVGLAITKNSQLHIPQLYAEMYNTSSSDDSSEWNSD